MHVSLRGITVDFGNLRAVDKVSLEANAGEIHAVVGENGAGKSTIMSVLYGSNTDFSGDILCNGKRVSWSSPRDAIKAGIGMVHQHFMLVGNLTVLENITLGNELINQFGFIKFNTIRANILNIISRYKIHIDLDELVDNLSVAQRQIVEIIKLLYRESMVLILDEPTAVLTPNEREIFFHSLRNFKAENKTIILITHKIDEVMDIADHVTVLRNGKLISSSHLNTTNKEKISQEIVGREIPRLNIKRGAYENKKILDVKDVIIKTNFNAKQAINFCIKKGEIIGIAGVSGNGQTELIETLIGIRRASDGEINLLDRNIINENTQTRRMMGISFVPQDRQRDGLALGASVWENACITKVNNKKFSWGSFLRKENMKAFSRSLIREFNIKVNGPDALVRTMSGGNMQKLVVARELSSQCPLIIIENPTWGIDIGSIAFIHQKIMDIKSAGVAILLVSNELDEITSLSDSAFVMYEGTLSKRISKGENFRELIGQHMLSGFNTYYSPTGISPDE